MSNISKLEREAGVKFEHISAPQPADIAKAVGGDDVEVIILVVDSVIPVFKSSAEELLNNFGLTPVELLPKALAKSIVSLYIFCILKFDFIFFPYCIMVYFL
ncbi:DEAD-box ATP-dependent RNA helicase 7 [Lactuca sativa]|uniref:DEAD-box ATP-dependent RNA helicase 7 n=1 Tax=Lactuca sativa TaxID=4236 RepID=UPI000CD9F3C0|nr:DEAD-box ATP-dependent RNA helicase 7 [Lactuca sativa]